MDNQISQEWVYCKYCLGVSSPSASFENQVEFLKCLSCQNYYHSNCLHELEGQCEVCDSSSFESVTVVLNPEHDPAAGYKRIPNENTELSKFLLKEKREKALLIMGSISFIFIFGSIIFFSINRGAQALRLQSETIQTRESERVTATKVAQITSTMQAIELSTEEYQDALTATSMSATLSVQNTTKASTSRAEPTLTKTPRPTSTRIQIATPLPQTFDSNEPNSILGGGSGLIAYTVVSLSGHSSLATYNMETDSERIIVTDSNDHYSPTWSPDGNIIAYLTVSGRNYKICTIVLATDRINCLTSNNTGLGFPSWSPDGSKILFHSNSAGLFDIYIMNSDGSEVRNLTANHPNDIPYLAPDWSPDGQQIVYTEVFDDRRQIAVMSANGSNRRLLTDNLNNSHSNPQWSPDGSQIAFYMVPQKSVTQGIYIISLDGSSLTQVTSGQDYLPSWSPDGQWIIFHRIEGGQRVIYRVRPDGSDETSVINFSNEPQDVEWQP